MQKEKPSERRNHLQRRFASALVIQGVAAGIVL